MTLDHTRHFLSSDGRQRSYLLYRPEGRLEQDAIAVVLAFHAAGTNATSLIEMSGLSEMAAKQGFAVVYPEGTGSQAQSLTWNAGNCCGTAWEQQVDDVAFVREILSDLEQHVPVDPTRVYATGISNGAMLCYRLAAELSERIAAIAPIAGPMVLDRCEPKRPVPVCHFHGTLDEFIPYEGGIGQRSVSKTWFRSVRETIRTWARVNGCDPVAETRQLPVKVGDGTYVIRSLHPCGPGGSEVVLYTIVGGGHTWPGRPSRFSVLGPTTANVDANEVLWNFFQRHPLRDLPE